MKKNQRKYISPSKFNELIEELNIAPILDSRIRQVRWLYRNASKCRMVYDEKLVRLIVHKLTTRIKEMEVTSNPEIAVERDSYRQMLVHWESLSNVIMSHDLPFINDSPLVPEVGIRLLDHYKADKVISDFRIKECASALRALLTAPYDVDSKRMARELLSKLDKK